MPNQHAMGRAEDAGALAKIAKRGAMALAALAFSAGLYAQLGLNFISSLAAGISLFVMMALAHAAYARSRANEYALNELAGATAEMERFAGAVDSIEQLAGATYRIDDLTARLHELEERVAAGAAEEDGLLVAGHVEQFERLSAEIDSLDTRLEALRQEMHAEARNGRHKIAAEMQVIEGLVKQMAAHIGATTARPKASEPPHAEAQHAAFAPHDRDASFNAHHARMGAMDAGEGEPSITWSVEPASAPALEPLAQELQQPLAQEPLAQGTRAQGTRAPEAPRPEPRAETPRSDHEPARKAEPASSAPPIDTATLDAAILDAVRRSVEANQIDLFLQPIVTLPQRQVRYYEALTRLRDSAGQILLPDDYLHIAEDAGMMPLIDNVMLYRSVQVLRRLSERANARGVFCNISVHSLLDTEFFPEFISFTEQNRGLAENLHFEFSQAMVESCGALELESLGALAALGFRFSLDRVKRLNVDFQRLHELGFRFVKLDSDLLLNHMTEAGARIHAADMRAYLDRYGLQLIAEKVEDERSLADLLDFDIKLGQGYLFSEPRPVRPEVFRPGDAAAAA